MTPEELRSFTLHELLRSNPLRGRALDAHSPAAHARAVANSKVLTRQQARADLYDAGLTHSEAPSKSELRGRR